MTKAKSKPTSLVLRTCAADMSSQNNFVWPQVGEVAEAPDWRNDKECGHGLHGWLFGHGDHGCSSYLDSTSKWLVVEVESDSIVMLGGKCKFPRGKVLFVGDKKDATDFLLANEPRARDVAVIGAQLTVGNQQTVIVGALGTATAGDRGTATAGYSGTATAGYSGTATAGYSGTATAGALGTATAGDRGTATAGALGTATAGDRGTATAGYSGTATAGALGTATAGDRGTATAGYRGEIRVRWYDDKNDRYRTVIGYVGEDGIEANVAYRLDDNHKFTKA
ncbi:DUF7666 domain-containing protein [Caballeronia sp. DA-9]|uniref:DUF7666 domain-containing protein n=1 Tax=Caballeronia sp. DA-9 TaxID=3436237 RepID=UPI003F667F7B